MSVHGAGASAPANGLVGYWSFDDGSGSTAADGSGNGRTGTLQYGPTWASSGSCRVGGCLSFDGTDDYIGRQQALRVRAGPDPRLGAVSAALVAQGAGRDAVFGDPTTSIEANQWQHVVLVRTGVTRQMQGYKNGVPALSSSYPFSPGTSSYALNIGRNPGGKTNFRGWIDEVRIYDRALSASEIQALYAS